jgi:hypothetical protein
LDISIVNGLHVPSTVVVLADNINSNSIHGKPHPVDKFQMGTCTQIGNVLVTTMRTCTTDGCKDEQIQLPLLTDISDGIVLENRCNTRRLWYFGEKVSNIIYYPEGLRWWRRGWLVPYALARSNSVWLSCLRIVGGLVEPGTMTVAAHAGLVCCGTLAMDVFPDGFEWNPQLHCLI